MIKVRIKKLPKARTGYQVQGSLANDIPAMGGADYDAYTGKPDIKESKYIKAVPRDEANLEAEGGETVYGDINGDGLPEHKIIKGPRHHSGGVPLNLPEDTFIFSDTKSMKISDKNILKAFGKNPKDKKSYTPAELAKQYDLEKYRKILQDPNSDSIAVKTAILMIKNFNMKLGALALAQESKKGFPQGIPLVAQPFMEAMKISPEQILPPDLPQSIPNNQDQNLQEEPREISEEDMMAMQQQDPSQMEQAPMAMYGMSMGGYNIPFLQDGGWYNQDMIQGSTQFYIPNRKALNKDYLRRKYPNSAIGNNTPIKQYGGYSYFDGPENNFYNEFEGVDDMPMFNNGGTPPSNAEIVKRSDYATEEDYEFALKKAYYNSKKSGKKLYVEENGKYDELQPEFTDVDAYQGQLEAGWGTDKNASLRAGQYAAIEKALSDPATAKFFADYTRKALEDKESYKGKSGTYGKKYEDRGFGDPSQLTDEEIVNSFKEHQKRNLMIASSGYESYLFRDDNGKLRSFDSSGTSGDGLGFKDVIMKTQNPATGKPYTETEAKAQYDKFIADGVNSLDDAFKKVGLELPAVSKGTASEKKALLQQATFQGYDDMIKDLEAGRIQNADDAARVINFVGNIQRGYVDETGQVVTDISPIDAFYTNTTAGQISAIKRLKFKKLQQPCPCKDENGNVVERDANGNCPCPDGTKDCPCGIDPITKECKDCPDEIQAPPPPAQWWLQDTINTMGAFGDLMGIKKYMPWSPRVNLEEPRPTFLDPTRELAQQSEQANIAIQGLAGFAGPQELSARASSVQGTGAKAAADTLSRINNANVGIADQFEMKQVDIRNQESMANQAAQQKLYDSNIIANQQFDNAKLAGRNLLRKYYTNAITNKRKTQTLNNLYPQYAVTPADGGSPAFKGGKKIIPGTGGNQKTYNEWVQYYRDTGMSDSDAIDAATQAVKNQSSGGTDQNALDIIQAQYSKFGGKVFQNGGYNYGNIVYPFNDYDY